MFNLSILNGVVPSQLKIAKVIPIYKTGQKTNIDNYRPISLLSSFSKILEKIVASRLTIFLNNSNLLSKWQFGFRADHSTIHPMVHLMNYVAESSNKKKHSLAIFCDLKKAFDTCNHEILFEKLKKYGINNVELNWFQSYLTDRKQYVSIHGFNSSLLNVTLGVPQGSILGPLLFLLYINDLPLASEFITLLFADDTTLLASHEDFEQLSMFANNQFRIICEFFRINKMVLHPDKTKFILFEKSNPTQNIKIFINNNNENENKPLLINEIERISENDQVPAIKFLGVYFDPCLNFKFHLSTLRKKLSKALYSLRLVKNTLSEKSLLLIYNSIFHCHLLYAIQIWSCTSPGFINNIFKMQKAAVRIINGSKYNSHTEPIFKKLNILPLPDLIHFTKLQFMHRFSQKFLPESFSATWVKNAIRNIGENEIMLRNFNQIRLDTHRLSSFAKNPLFDFPKIWESFPDANLKFLRNKTEFDTKLKLYFLNDLDDNIMFCAACFAARSDRV